MVFEEDTGRRDDENAEESPESHEPLTVEDSPFSLSAEIDNGHVRKRAYLPSCFNLYDKIKGSIYLAFISHLCFILASAFYLKLSLLIMDWNLFAKRTGIPEEVFHADTDEIWISWLSERNEAGYIFDKRQSYNAQYELLYILGSIGFVFVGIFDLLRYFDCFNMVLVLGGVAGMISALSKTYRATTTWDFISVHLFLLEGINLLHRKHDYEGVACFRIGDLCFLSGAILDCVGSYAGIAHQEGLWVLHMDLFSCCLWLFSALTDFTAEVYYLVKHKVIDGAVGTVNCY